MRSTCHSLGVVRVSLLTLFVLSIPDGVSRAGGDEQKPEFGVFVASRDAEIAASIKKVIVGDKTFPLAVIFDSLEEAVASEAEVLVLVIPRSRKSYPEKTIANLKQRKVLGIGYGSAQIFAKLGLEINGGACAHFGKRVPDVKVKGSPFLGKKRAAKTITPYKENVQSDNFGMFIPAHSELLKFVDVIARFVRNENYAPIVRQNNHVMVGLSAPSSTWSDEYQTLIRDVSIALLRNESTKFSTAQFKVLAPGTHRFGLGKGRSTKKPFGKKFYFKFKKPTRFKATLDHTGSSNMMMIFMGSKNRLHLERQDAKAGEQLTIT